MEMEYKTDGIVSKIDQFLGHKTSLTKYKTIEIIFVSYQIMAK